MKRESRAVLDWYLARTRKSTRTDDPDSIRMRPQYEWDDLSRGVMGGETAREKENEAGA